MAAGTYSQNNAIVDQKSIHIHGYGAVIRPELTTQADPTSWMRVSNGTLSISGVTIEQVSQATNSIAMRCTTNGTLRLEDVRFAAPYTAIGATDCNVSVSGSSFLVSAGTARAIDVYGPNTFSFSMERSRIDRSQVYISAGLNITNNVFYEGNANFVFSEGLVSFNTFYNSMNTGDAVTCTSRDPERARLHANIIWTPSATIGEGQACRTDNNLIGPISSTCTTCDNFNEDPQFVDAPAGNVHLKMTSLALNRMTMGPSVDFDGDSRPSGSGWDVGFDEVP